VGLSILALILFGGVLFYQVTHIDEPTTKKSMVVKRTNLVNLVMETIEELETPTSASVDDAVAEDGYIKRSALSEFRITGRATKGVRIQNTDCLCSILSLSKDQDILVNSSKAQIRLKLSDIPLLSRGTQGVKSIKLSENSKVLKLNGV
jgi:DNA gyrase subunit A